MFYFYLQNNKNYLQEKLTQVLRISSILNLKCQILLIHSEKLFHYLENKVKHKKCTRKLIRLFTFTWPCICSLKRHEYYTTLLCSLTLHLLRINITCYLLFTNKYCILILIVILMDVGYIYASRVSMRCYNNPVNSSS